MKRLTRIDWYRSDGIKQLYTEDASYWVNRLKQQNAFFIVYPGDGPVPSLKSEKVAV